ncbi:MAG TPA: very short patch repair endonuclease [Candidatus Methylacidiphilales bacterium]|nr:very short patch repair endonuclease [Candidatus Methylacidiphilales bacterium]
MVDSWTTAKRSEVMALVRNKGNKSTELRLIALLRYAGIKGWRRHPKLPGKPDFVFPELRTVVFVDGDFWHGNPATYRPPKSNIAFWERKIRYNRENDKRVNANLKKRNWIVVRLWESELNKKPDKVALKLIKRLDAVAKLKSESQKKVGGNQAGRGRFTLRRSPLS